MLILYSILSLGGIETFFVRLAKQRAQQGLKTTFLFVGEKSRCDAHLLGELQQHADIHFLSEFTWIPQFIFKRIPIHFRLLAPLRSKKLRALLRGIEHVHLAEAKFFMYFARLRRLLPQNARPSMGVYHSKEYTWKWGQPLPYFERINRHAFFRLMPPENIIFFNDRLPQEYSHLTGYDFSASPRFPLGVIDLERPEKKQQFQGSRLDLVSVGRLVDFKTYNLWTIDVLQQLRDQGIDAHYHIYGEGNFKAQIEQKAQQSQLGHALHFHGNIPYSQLAHTLLQYDVFIGSGTAIVEAASVGLPSIIGIESETDSLSYGYLSEIPGFSYNENGLYPKKPVAPMLEAFYRLSEAEKIELSEQHVEKSALFSIQECSRRFDQFARQPLKDAGWRPPALAYCISYFWFSLKHKIAKKSMNKTIYG